VTLTAAGLAALTYALVEGADKGFGTVTWAVVVAAVALPALVVWTLRARDPLVPPSLFRHPNLAAANIVTFLVYAALGGFLLYVPIYLQFLGFSPLSAGLALTPTSLLLALLASRFGALADRRGPRLYLTFGATLIGVGILLLALVVERSGFWTFGVAGLGVLSLGLASLVAPITATAIGSASRNLAGVASGVNQTVARVGGLVAVAAIGLTIAVVFDARGGPRGATPLARETPRGAAHDASVDAFRAGALLAAGLALAGALVAATRISDHAERGS